LMLLYVLVPLSVGIPYTLNDIWATRHIHTTLVEYASQVIKDWTR
jgi:hypothetical protein